jgi:protein arginine N-methyltransferase 1
VSVHALPRVLEYHGEMLADEARVEAFARAIEARVSPGDVVLDLGGGTGILSALACRAGAARVYMIESGPVLAFARELLAANGLAQRVVTLEGHSTAVSLPEPVDVIVSETIGVAAFDEGILAAVLDARRRFARAGSTPIIVPQSLAAWAAPVTDGQLHERLVGRWGSELSGATGYDLGALRARVAHHMYIRRIAAEALVAPGRALTRVDLASADDVFVEGAVTFSAERAAVVHGFAVWFEAELAPGIALSNAPAGAPSHWSHGFLPVPVPLEIAAGGVLSLDVQINDGGLWRWRGGVEGGARFDQCTAFGAPLDQLWSAGTKPA